MNTILQKRIEEAASHYLLHEHKSPLNEILHQCDLKTEMQYHRDIEQAYIEGGKNSLQNQWISVEEDLPPYDKDVFVRFISRFPNNTDEFEIGYCTRWRTLDKSVKTDSKGFSIIGDMEITHWMMIPTINKEEK